MSSPKFSIIMPAYNRAYCVRAAVESVMAQTYPEWELIVVDDGSTDGTREIICKMAESEPRIRLLEVEHGGVSAARNAGLSLAENDWIAFIDSDNRMRPGFLDTFASAISRDAGQLNFYGALQKTASRDVLRRPYDYNVLVRGNFIDIGVYVAHKQLFSEDRFDERLGGLEDWDLILRHAKRSSPKFLDVIVLDYSDDTRKDRLSMSKEKVKSDEAIIRVKQRRQGEVI